MCDCHSANNPDGKDKAILLKPFWESQKEFVSVDYCISDVIKYLWNNKIETGGCCCGHNKQNPSVIIGENENVEKTFKLICEIDSRNWVVSRWERQDYSIKAREPLFLATIERINE